MRSLCVQLYICMGMQERGTLRDLCLWSLGQGDVRRLQNWSSNLKAFNNTGSCRKFVTTRGLTSFSCGIESGMNKAFLLSLFSLFKHRHGCPLSFIFHWNESCSPKISGFTLPFIVLTNVNSVETADSHGLPLWWTGHKIPILAEVK